ncbi:MAG TPA: nucleoside triphosphate pyrophosphohydrolase, partial [Actinobacteria bacterium]|nr:nucleoside triphosphate pyrophosphohydrolase [Actinomycetota bacterium]
MSHPIRIVGLGPAGLDRLGGETREALLDPAVTVVVRTLEHPAATELAARRRVVDCDDLYRAASDFAAVYAGIVDRVRRLAGAGPVIYAVPGSPLVGETAVRTLVAGGGVAVVPGESFLDLALLRTGLDPLERGLQVLDAHDLGFPLLLHVPTLISQVDTPGTLLAVRDALLALLGAETPIVRLADLGSPDEVVETIALEELRPEHAGLRVTLLVDVPAPGWPGLVRTNARLRRECPWDREQTHHTLARHLLEESYETLAALESLPPEAPGGEPDVAAYVEVEEELGDLLLQVVFHANLAAEAGMFAIEEVAEAVRRKLVARHPHVFGEVDAKTAEQVLANWDRLKTAEKGRESLLDGVPAALPALARADSLQRRAAGAGFDWPDLSGVIAKVHEEIAEVLAAGADHHHEVGDLLFSVVNLARRLEVDPEQALRAAADRFERRFRVVEGAGDLKAMTFEEMDEAWEEAKR